MNPISYFSVTDLDRSYFQDRLEKRLPRKILDAHAHISLPEHTASIPQERIDSDWALQSGGEMSIENARFFADSFFPGRDYRFAALPVAVKEADTDGNNRYIASLIKSGKIDYGFITTRPEAKVENIEKDIRNDGFTGLKPYPDYVSAFKGAELSIPAFFPWEHCALAERLNKCVVLHLPRAGRFADENNIRELREIAARFPKLKIVIAHLGRSFNLCYFEKAAEILGDDIHHFWFDTAAVMNPQVHKLAMQILHPDRILYGLDLPVFLFHGSRRWTETGYYNVCREDLPWNKHIEGKEAEAKYTFFVYEQVNNILNTMEELGKDEAYKQGFFYNNAEKLFSGCV
ncbi:MAG: amidohydrolase family protein [Treponema sp.]|jgi:predicted TIM-barrel fold metal-dependent hydrolase|nr:amidohydrolase family protein [Treponema sp.]